MNTDAWTPPRPRPADLAEAAAEAIRTLNHATRPAVTALDPTEIYTVLGALAQLAAALSQALSQVQMHLHADRITVTAGEFVGDPAAAIACVRACMTQASAAAAPLAAAIDTAHQVLADLASYDSDQRSVMTDQGVSFQPLPGGQFSGAVDTL